MTEKLNNEQVKKQGDKRFPWLYAFMLSLLFFAVMMTYILKQYDVSAEKFELLKLKINASADKLLVYPLSQNGIEPDFSNPIAPVQFGDTLVFQLNKCRQFRLYFTTAGNYLFANEGSIVTETGLQLPAFSRFERSVFYKPKAATFPLNIIVDENAFLQVSKLNISKAEFMLFTGIAAAASVLAAMLMLFLFGDFFKGLSIFSRLQIGAAAIFCLAIFLPLPAANIALMASFLLLLKEFKLPRKRAAFLVALPLFYFVWMLVVTLYRSGVYYSPLIETSLPFFFLPLYFLCCSGFSFTKAFLPAALLLTLFFITAAIFDFSLFHNVGRFSFDAFTIYFHPVYYAYLIVFAIIVLVFQSSHYSNFQQGLAFAILGAGLLFAGSKLMIGFATVFILQTVYRKHKIAAVAVAAVLMGVLLLFAPLRKRFLEIENLNHLSIAKENSISKNDARINGLSIRIIIWQECLAELNSAGDLLLGKGTGKEVDDRLHNRLVKRGLVAGTTWYDPHNQYIATLYRFGVPGLICLLLMLASGIRLALKHNNQLLLWSTLLLIVAMLTESILQRAAGVYVFICILLPQTFVLLSNTANSIENRDFRHPGNPQ